MKNDKKKPEEEKKPFRDLELKNVSNEEINRRLTKLLGPGKYFLTPGEAIFEFAVLVIFTCCVVFGGYKLLMMVLASFNN